MGKPAAERQAASRARRMDTARLEVRVDRQTLEALGRLARHRGLTIGATVEQAIGEACRAMVDSPGAGDAKAVAEPARALSSDGQPLKSWRDRFRERGVL